MDFSDALNALKSGNPICRKGWNGSGQFLNLQIPDENSKMSVPYIYITTVQGHCCPWVASQTDLLCDDWQVIVPKTVQEN